MKFESLTLAVFTACLLSFCAQAETVSIAKPDEGDLNIKLSPAAAQKAQRDEKFDLYRRKVGGEDYAAELWSQLKPGLRAVLLGELAATKESELVRKRAMRDLALMKKEDDADLRGLASLLSVAVADPDGEMRKTARQALVARGDERTPRLLTKALKRKEDVFRNNAAVALREIGGPRVFEVLIEHWKETWGPGPRGHIFVGRQQSYVGDYDISADNYDPQVKTFLAGTVLDVKSLRVEGDIYYITIRQVAGDDVRVDAEPEAWDRWLDKNRKALDKEATRRRNDAIGKLHTDDDDER